MLLLPSVTANLETFQILYLRSFTVQPLWLIYLLSQVKTADIVVAAIGSAEFVKGSWIKPGAIVIDVGINYVPGKLNNCQSKNVSYNFLEDATKKSGQRLVGDVEYATSSEVASYITPVPGGVGPMTVAILMENTLQAAIRQWEYARNRKVKPLTLKVSAKVPSDIDIAMAQTPKPIVELAEELGILSSELESYGQYKAKVDLSIIDRLNYRKDGKYIVISG